MESYYHNRRLINNMKLKCWMLKLKEWMFKKRMFPFNCLVPMDKEEFINELRSDTRFFLYLKDNDQAIVYDTTQKNLNYERRNFKWKTKK